MERQNRTSVTEFILLGLTDDLYLQILLFVIFSFVYFATLLGNIVIFMLIWNDPLLQNPMYFFLSNLAFVDLCFSTTVTPNMLVNFLRARKTISFSGCAVQLFFFSAFGISECFILGVMAYDRYVAICNPLLYPVIINQKICVHLTSATYVVSVLIATPETIFTFSQSFCKSNLVDHVFCDYPPLLKLPCSDTYANEMVIFLFIILISMGSCSITLTSYCFIISTILKIDSATGRRKAFSTCGSHLTVISLFYGTVLLMYLQLAFNSSMTQSKVLSVFYTVMIPMLNPMIYSLRNKEVKRAFNKYFC
ncbi:olfactory receptor 5G3-like [Lissotriton helveticus]